MGAVAFAGTAALAAALLTAPPAHAADAIVTDSAELIAAVQAANATPGPDTIVVSGTITLAADIPDITDSLVIRGADADAVIDGDGRFSGIRARGGDGVQVDSLTVESLTLQNIRNIAIYAESVTAVTIADVTVDGATNQGVSVYASSPGDRITLANIHVAETRYQAVSLRLFSGATATADGVHVRDAGRAEESMSASEASAISVQAWHSDSRATLRNISFTETTADRDTGSRPLAAVGIDAAGTSQVSIEDAEIAGGEHGVEIDAADTARVAVETLRIGGHAMIGVEARAGGSANVELHDVAVVGGEEGIAVDAVDAAAVAITDVEIRGNQLESFGFSAESSARIAVSGFELAQGAAAGSWSRAAVDAGLRDAAVLQLADGLIEQPQREGIDITGGTLFASGGQLVVRDVDVVDAVETTGIHLWGLMSTELDAVTVSDSGWSGIYWGVGRAGSGDAAPTLAVRNSTISGTVEHGLAIDNGVPGLLPTATIDSSTFVDSAEHGVFVYDRTGSERFPADVTVRNSIVNSSSEMMLTDNLATSLSSGHTLWSAVDADFADFLTASETGNIVNVDPELAPLADNGGPTRTHLPAAASPVIDAGDPAAAAYAPAADQRGQSRILGTIDMGSVEAGTLEEEPVGEEPGDGEPSREEPGDGDSEHDGAEAPDGTEDGSLDELPVISAPTPEVTGETLPRTGSEVEARLLTPALGLLLLGTALLAAGIRAARRRG